MTARIVAIFFAFMAACAGPARAESGPTSIVVAFSAGGTSWTIARILADSLERSTKSTVLVDPRPGASGLLAAAYVKHQPHDGKTLLLMASASTLAIPPSKDWDYVGRVAAYKYMFVTQKGLPSTLESYFAAAKRDEKLRSLGSSGAGTLPHLIAEKLFADHGIRMVHVPYKGSAPAIQDVVGGHLASALVPYTDMIPWKDSVQVIARSGKEIAEEGWMGIFVPAGLPKATLAKLQAQFEAATTDSKDALIRLGFEPAWQSGEVLARTHRAEYERYKPLADSLGISFPKE